MSKPTIYLDLDRTLFQTNEAGQIWKKIEQMHPDVIDAAKEHQRRKRFYVWSDDMYCHDVSAQLRTLGLNPAQIYDEVAHSELADGRFEYEGCDSLIEYLKRAANPVILTYGTDDYQRFKVSLCPSLYGIAVETILEAKPQWLRAQGASGWLVDDKVIGQEIPDGITFIQLSHTQAFTDATAWKVFRTLHEVEAYFRTVFDTE